MQHWIYLAFTRVTFCGCWIHLNERVSVYFVWSRCFSGHSEKYFWRKWEKWSESTPGSIWGSTFTCVKTQQCTKWHWNSKCINKSCAALIGIAILNFEWHEITLLSVLIRGFTLTSTSACYLLYGLCREVASHFLTSSSPKESVQISRGIIKWILKRNYSLRLFLCPEIPHLETAGIQYVACLQ